MNGFDRELRSLALGGRSLEKRQLLDRLSSGTLGAALAQPLALILSGDAPHRWERDLPVWGEAAAVSIAVNQVVKHLTHRTRPYAEFCEPQRDSELCVEEVHLSFYSGHTSSALVAAVAAGTIADLHHLRSRTWVWGTGLTLATTTGVLRVAADRHYATDVIAGAVAGGLAGWLIPRIHRAEDEAPAVAGIAASRGSGALLAFGLPTGSRGASLSLKSGVVEGGPYVGVEWGW